MATAAAYRGDHEDLAHYPCVQCNGTGGTTGTYCKPCHGTGLDLDRTIAPHHFQNHTYRHLFSTNRERIELEWALCDSEYGPPPPFEEWEESVF